MRKGGEESDATKPKARAFSDRASLTKKLEKLVRDQELGSVIDPVALALFQADESYYIDLVLYKLNKHADNPAKAVKYSVSIPAAARWKVFERAWAKRNTEGVAALSNSAWIENQARCEKFAYDDPGFFVDHMLIDGFRRSEKGKLILAGLTQEKEFLANLKQANPAAFGRLTAAVPVLRLVDAVQQEVVTAESGGATLSVDAVVRKVFDAFVSGKHMEVAYSGTKIDENSVILTGSTDQDATQRADNDAKLKLNLPGKLSTACHQLLHLLTSTLKSYPGLDDVVITSADEPTAVLTVPLNTLAGGLIGSGYSGNVFNAVGQPTNQIFFSGNRAKISKSHSWLVVNGVAYDPVLGTVGDDVKAAIAGKFEFPDDENSAVEIGGVRTFTKETVKKPTGEYGLTTAWRLG